MVVVMAEGSTANTIIMEAVGGTTTDASEEGDPTVAVPLLDVEALEVFEIDTGVTMIAAIANTGTDAVVAPAAIVGIVTETAAEEIVVETERDPGTAGLQGDEVVVDRAEDGMIDPLEVGVIPHQPLAGKERATTVAQSVHQAQEKGVPAEVCHLHREVVGACRVRNEKGTEGAVAEVGNVNGVAGTEKRAASMQGVVLVEVSADLAVFLNRKALSLQITIYLASKV
mmetsp:Transcript_5308/g.7807  ORF Transcript_5308/g.7807 Transcript_5308/m.7807 type:complete len:227 (-) Transcript_5308:853-1533(-)